MGKKKQLTQNPPRATLFPNESYKPTIQTQIKDLRVGSHLLQLEVIHDLEKARSAILASALKTHRESRTQDLCPHFGVIWPAAQALADYMMQILEGSCEPIQCLELGCGLGIPSLCMAQKTNIQMIASDHHEYVPEFLQRNILRNNAQGLVYQKLDWRLWPSFSVKYPWTKMVSLDFVVGSDLLYEAWQPAALAFTLKSLIGSHGTGVIADPGRKHLSAFETAIVDAGLTITDQQLVKVAVSRSPTKIHILTIRDQTRITCGSLEI